MYRCISVTRLRPVSESALSRLRNGCSRWSRCHGMTISAPRLSMTNANSSRVAHSGAGLVVRGRVSGIRDGEGDEARGARHDASARPTYASGLGDVPLELDDATPSSTAAKSVHSL